MEENMEIGKKYDLDIRYIKSDGNGVAFGPGPDQKIVLIEGVNEEDSTVRVEIINILEKVAFAKRLSRVKTDTKVEKVRGGVESPYSPDDDNGEGYDEDEDEDDLGDEEDDD